MDFYYQPMSAPCRSVLMTATAFGVKLNKKLLDVHGGENKTPEFLKLNPQHSIPTLVDGDFSIWESRAIMVYLAEKYGKKDCSLYPSCPKKRALINQRLYFDMGTLYKSFADCFPPLMQKNEVVFAEMYKKVEQAFEFLNTFLKDNEYVAGDTLTLADIAILANVSSLVVVGFDLSKYCNVKRWYANVMKTAPGAEENYAGCLELKKLFDSKGLSFKM